VNGYVEVTESKSGLSAVTIYGTPGLTAFTVVPGTGGIRSLYTSAATGRVFAVRGDELHEVFADGTTGPIGVLRRTAGPVSVAESLFEVIWVDAPHGYALHLESNLFALISDPVFLEQGAGMVGYLDGYFLFTRPLTDQFYLFQSGNPPYDALDTASAEGAPDKLVALAILHREVWLLGTTTMEVWYNAGTADFPFARMQGGVIDTGCLAPHSVAIMNEQLYWVGGNQRGGAVVMRAKGYMPEPISTHAVSAALQGYARVDDALAYTYQQDGHAWYILTFPEANVTWAFDAATELWSERSFWNAPRARHDRHRVHTHCMAWGRHLVGDHESGQLYWLDTQAYSDGGAPLRREVELPPVYDQDHLGLVAHKRLQLDMDVGVGTPSGQGVDPQVMLTWSSDGGQTWTPEHWRPLGRIGETLRRVQWWQLGAARDRRYRVAMSDPVPFTLLSAYVDVGPPGP
jgi:hypothetical protein